MSLVASLPQTDHDESVVNGHLTGFAAGGGAMVRAEALASLVSTARFY